MGFRLEIEQGPLRACGSEKERERKPCDPPPILKALPTKDAAHVDYELWQQSPNVFVSVTAARSRPPPRQSNASSVATEQNKNSKNSKNSNKQRHGADGDNEKEEDDEENDDDNDDALCGGTRLASMTSLRGLDDVYAGYFVFSDIRFKSDGWFKLRFDMYEMVLGSSNIDQLGESCNVETGGLGGHGCARLLASVKSDPVRVFSPRSFPGIQPPTELTRMISDQGTKYRGINQSIHRSERSARRKVASVGGYAHQTSVDEISIADQQHQHNVLPGSDCDDIRDTMIKELQRQNHYLRALLHQHQLSQTPMYQASMPLSSAQHTLYPQYYQQSYSSPSMFVPSTSSPESLQSPISSESSNRSAIESSKQCRQNNAYSAIPNSTNTSTTFADGIRKRVYTDTFTNISTVTKRNLSHSMPGSGYSGYSGYGGHIPSPYESRPTPSGPNVRQACVLSGLNDSHASQRHIRAIPNQSQAQTQTQAQAQAQAGHDSPHYSKAPPPFTPEYYSKTAQSYNA